VESELFGVDVKRGLALVGNNKTLYLKLLNSFSQNKIYEALEDAVAGGDLEQVRAQAHALKGVSGNLHLGQVYELAKSIEGEARAQRPVARGSGMYEGFRDAYARTMDSVNAIIGDPALLEAAG